MPVRQAVVGGDAYGGKQLRSALPSSPLITGAPSWSLEFDGSITDASDQGLYSRDTRYLSRYQLYIDGEPWIFSIPARSPITRREPIS